jgi:hypothetical protein
MQRCANFTFGLDCPLPRQSPTITVGRHDGSSHPMFRTRHSLSRIASPPSSLRPLQPSRCVSRQVGRQKGSKHHWTPEKLATSDTYPLTHLLNERMHPSNAPKKEKKMRSAPGTSKTLSAVNLRTQIVSPRLCGMCVQQASSADADTHRRCFEVHGSRSREVQGMRHPRSQPRCLSLVAEAPRLFATAEPCPP